MSEARIQFDDGPHPDRSQSGGVYRLRSKEVAGIGSIPLPRHPQSAKNEASEIESVTNIEDRDYKSKQV